MARRKQSVAAPVEAAAEAPLRLEWRSPAELAENPANWRRHPDEQISALTGVLAEVGWAGACLFNERTQRLIDGHARRKVALEQGTEKVPVLVGDWSEEQERKILATLDPLAALASADKDRLDALLREVQTENQAVALMLGELAANNKLYEVNGDGEPDDPNEHWQGMPEFEQEDKSAWKRLIVNFENKEDYEAFARLIGQTLTEKTKSVWHPYREKQSAEGQRWSSESETPDLHNLEGEMGDEANEQGS